MNLIENKKIIVFGEDFARHPHSLEHLLRPLFLTNQFIWVETIGLRSPRLSFYDLKKMTLKIFRWLSTDKKISSVTQKPNTVHIVTPLMVPYNQFSIIRRLNQFLVLRAVRKKMIELNFQADYTITSLPNSCDYVGHFNEQKIVYVCVDEYSLWPGFNFKMISEMEKKLLQKADFVFATSTQLAQTKSNHKTETILLTHGVDFEHFKLPQKTKSSETIKICYFGLFDERTDQSILQYVAEHLKNSEIYIIGPVACNISQLTPYQNIIFTGAIEYTELPEKISDMDAFILPYKKNELSKNMNPLKLKEYLSTGRPVISTSIAEVEKLKDYLFIADTGKDFKNILDILKKNELKFDAQKTQAYISETQTWSKKALEFSKKIN